MDIFSIGMKADTRDLDRGKKTLTDFGREAANTEKKVTQSTSRMTSGAQQMAAVIRQVQIAFAALGSGLGLARALGEFADFEQGMKNVAAVSGATADELAQLEKVALRAAASTRFNPEQTTQALYALASAGQSASQQMASLPNVLNLAEAAQADLGRTTELMTATISQFNLQAEDSQRVADVFTASIGASALNVDRLLVGFRNAGPTAAALNQSLEGTTAALGILTTSFGNGERAGTGFRALLNELPKNAESLGVNLYETNGAMRPFVDILSDLERQGITASQAVSIFGAEAGPALAALLTQGSSALDQMEDKLQSNGQAADVAAKQIDSLKGDIATFASAVAVAFIEIGDSQQGIARDTLQTGAALIKHWSGYGDTLGEAQESTAQLAETIENVASIAAVAFGSRIVGAMSGVAVQFARNQAEVIRYQSALASMAGVSKTAATAQIALSGAAGGLRAVMAALGGPAGVIFAASAALAYFVTQLESAEDRTNRLKDRLTELRDGADKVAADAISGEIEETQKLIDRITKDIEFLNDKGGSLTLFEEGQLEKYQSDLTLLIQTEGELIRKRDELQASAIEAASGLGDMTAQIEASVAAGAKSLTVLGDLVKGVNKAAEGTKGLKEEVEPTAAELREMEREAEAVRKELQRLNDAVADYTNKMIEAEGLQIAELRDARRVLDLVRQGLDLEEARYRVRMNSLPPLQQSTAEYEKQAQALDRLIQDEAELMRQSRQRAQESIDAVAQELDAQRDRMSQSISDAIINGGLNSVGDLIDILGNAIKAQTFEIILDPVMDQFAAQLQKVLNAQLSTFGGSLGQVIGGAVAGYALFDFAKGTRPEGSNLGSTAYGLLGSNPLTGAFTAVDSLTGGSLFGTGWKTKTQELAILITDGILDASIETMQKKKRGLFGGSKRRFRTDDAEELDAALGQAFSNAFQMAADAADALGVAVQDFTYSAEQSIKGLEGAELEAAVQELFSGATDALAESIMPGLGQLQLEGETLYDTLIRVAVQAEGVKNGLDQIGVGLDATGVKLVEASQTLLEHFGGSLDAFNAAASQFAQNFLSESERMTAQTEALIDQLNMLGVDAIPQTREQFANLVQGLDATDAAQAETLAGLLQLSGGMGTLYTALEQAAAGTDNWVTEVINANGALSGLLGDLVSGIRAAQQAASQAQQVTGTTGSTSSGSTNPTALRIKEMQREIDRLNDALTRANRSTRTVTSSSSGYSDAARRQAEADRERQRAAEEAARVAEQAARALEQLRSSLDNFDSSIENAIGGIFGMDNALASAYVRLSQSRGQDAISAGSNVLSALMADYREDAREIEESYRNQIRAVDDALRAELDRLDTVERAQREANEAQMRALLEQRDVATDLFGFVDSLDRSGATGTPLEQVNAALEQFRGIVVQAEGGDLEAARQIAGRGGELIDLARSVYGSGGAFNDIFNEVRNSAAGIASDINPTDAVIQDLQLATLRANELIEAQTRKAIEAAEMQIQRLELRSQIEVGVLKNDVVGAIRDLQAQVRAQSGLGGYSASGNVTPIRSPNVPPPNSQRGPTLSSGDIDRFISALEGGVPSSLNIKFVTPDGREQREETIRDLKERSRRGEIVLYVSGVAGAKAA